MARRAQSPVYTLTPTYYLHFLMEPHSRLEQKVGRRRSCAPCDIDVCHRSRPSMHRSCTSWRAMLSLASTTRAARHITRFVTTFLRCTISCIQVALSQGSDEEGLVVRTTDSSVSFVLLAGKPIGEPIVQYGPVRAQHLLDILPDASQFVMNTEEEIESTFADYQLGFDFPSIAA